jgi:hypothetical protein
MMTEDPRYGTIEYDADDKIICYVCERSFDLLSAHVNQSHGLSADDYRALFGLGLQSSLGSRRLNQRRSDLQRTRLESDPDYRAQLTEQAKAMSHGVSRRERSDRARYERRVESMTRGYALVSQWARDHGHKPPNERIHTDRECAFCGVHFLPITREIGPDGIERWRVTKNKTCSPDCLSKLRRGYQTGKPMPLNRKIPRNAYSDILARLATGESTRALAQEFGVSTESINRIRRKARA